MGSPAEGERFFDERWPEARAVSDENKTLYAAFGLARGSFNQLMGPRVLGAGLKSFLRHGVGLPVGDVRMMSGWFLIHEGKVVWEQVHEHNGEERRYGELTEAFAAARPNETDTAR